MSESAAIASSPCRPVATATKRALFALSDAELEAFFPDGVGPLSGYEIRRRPSGPVSASDWATLFEEFQPEVLVSCWSTSAVPEPFASGGSSLRYVCHLAGSVRGLLPRAFLEGGGLVSNWGALAGDNVAEHALLLALGSLRRQSAWLPLIHAPQPKPWKNGTMRLGTRTLIGRRVGIHGFGHVARALVRLLRPFNVEIHACAPGVPTQLMREAGVTPCASLVELAAQSEVLFGCEALTPQSRGAINSDVLAALPDGAVFVNVGRGPVVDEPALIREARDGRIFAALDVVSREPLQSSDPLLSIPDIIVSPHIAGPTCDRLADCGRQALENLAKYLRDEPVCARVTLELYDRAT